MTIINNIYKGCEPNDVNIHRKHISETREYFYSIVNPKNPYYEVATMLVTITHTFSDNIFSIKFDGFYPYGYHIIDSECYKTFDEILSNIKDDVYGLGYDLKINMPIIIKHTYEYTPSTKARIVIYTCDDGTKVTNIDCTYETARTVAEQLYKVNPNYNRVVLYYDGVERNKYERRNNL